jgi:murein DD-endopeptidase MepM/ murein hydrolase activator NlpD
MKWGRMANTAWPPGLVAVRQSSVMRAFSSSVPAALALTAVLSLGSSRGPRPPRSLTFPSPTASPTASPTESPAYEASHLPGGLCPRGTLPDGDACVHLPAAGEGDDGEGASEPETSVNTHRDPLGRWVVYDEIPRRPDRPADYDAYRYPVPCGANGCVVSGYDLDRTDEQQRRGRRLRQVGHGAVDLLEPRGTPIALVPLEHQEGPAEVVYVGPLFGNTVVTRHSVREAGRLRDYLMLFGHMDSTSPGIRPGAIVREGDVIGAVGDSGSPGRVHLHLEARRLRDGIDAAKLAPSALASGASSIVCDPRNVLPRR